MQRTTLQERLNGLSARERAIADLVARLSTDAGRVRDAEINHLGSYGLRDAEIREVVEIAISAYQHGVADAQAVEASPTLFDPYPYFFEGARPPGA